MNRTREGCAKCQSKEYRATEDSREAAGRQQQAEG